MNNFGTNSLFHKNLLPCPNNRVRLILRVPFACYLFHAGFLLGIYFDPKNRGDIFPRNVSWLLTGYTALHLRKYKSSKSPLWEAQILHLIFLFLHKREKAMQALIPKKSFAFMPSIQACRRFGIVLGAKSGLVAFLHLTSHNTRGKPLSARRKWYDRSIMATGVDRPPRSVRQAAAVRKIQKLIFAAYCPLGPQDRALGSHEFYSTDKP
jgi:hypothetical protein